jgi:hypothetical protein
VGDPTSKAFKMRSYRLKVQCLCYGEFFQLCRPKENLLGNLQNQLLETLRCSMYSCTTCLHFCHFSFFFLVSKRYRFIWHMDFFLIAYFLSRTSYAIDTNDLYGDVVCAKMQKMLATSCFFVFGGIQVVGFQQCPFLCHALIRSKFRNPNL